VSRTPTGLSRIAEIESWGIASASTTPPPPLPSATVSLVSSLNPSTAGQPVTFTTTVSGSAGTATGTVTFNDGASAICSGVSLSAGQATCTTSVLAAGTHSISAMYSGSSSYAATSATLSQTVNAQVIAPPPPPPSSSAVNVALATSGAVASASSTWSANF